MMKEAAQIAAMVIAGTNAHWIRYWNGWSLKNSDLSFWN
jgi:hypothetical protein